MNIAIRTDTRNIRRTITAMKSDVRPATADAVALMGMAVLRKAGLSASVALQTGTHRYARSWIHAHNTLAQSRPHLGVLPLIAPSLRRSKIVDSAAERLEVRRMGLVYNIDKLRAFRRQAMRGASAEINAMRPAVMKLNKEIDRLEEVLIRNTEQQALVESVLHRPGVLVMFGRATKQRFSLSNVERIYPAEFGATAQLVYNGNRATMVIRNFEPHANIVESRKRFLATAMADLRGETGGLIGVLGGRAGSAFLARVAHRSAPGTRVVRRVA